MTAKIVLEQMSPEERLERTRELERRVEEKKRRFAAAEQTERDRISARDRARHAERRAQMTGAFAQLAQRTRELMADPGYARIAEHYGRRLGIEDDELKLAAQLDASVRAYGSPLELLEPEDAIELAFSARLTDTAGGDGGAKIEAVLRERAELAAREESKPAKSDPYESRRIMTQKYLAALRRSGMDV